MLLGQIYLFFLGLFTNYGDCFWLEDIGFAIGGSDNYLPYEISLGDYLAMICSIITLVLIVFLCCLFVYKIIKLIGGLITR